MRYLTLIADYTQSPVRDGEGRLVELADLEASDELIGQIEAWNSDYKSIIPLDPDQRSAPENADRIAGLDRRGLELVERLVSELRDVKVGYFSEGLLRRLR